MDRGHRIGREWHEEKSLAENWDQVKRTKIVLDFVRFAEFSQNTRFTSSLPANRALQLLIYS